MQRVAIVTGGSNGIGAGIVQYLLQQHDRVVIADVVTPSHKALQTDRSRILYIKTNISSETAVSKLIKQTIARFGKLDVLINNAGIVIGEKRPAPEKLSLKEWQKTIDANLTGTFLCCKHAIPELRKQKGVIVNIASTRYLQSEPNTEAYSASKGGIVSLTHALAISLGPEIRVNCISPGWIHTEDTPLKKSDHQQHPCGRVGTVEDIAAIVGFLISENASFMTGQNFIVDGGMTKKMIYT
jgi:NAD(P)-dependent dehydrogenase (short-subunit alcohol dehydrogenase family)